VKVNKIATLTGHNASVFAVAEGEAKHYVISGAGDGWIVQWDLINPEVGRLIAKADANIYSICFVKEKQLLILGDMNGGIHWIPVANPLVQKNIAHHTKGVFEIQYIDNQVFSAGGDGVFTKWSLEKQRTLESIQLSNQSLRAFSFSKIRQEIAVAASDRNIYILDAPSLSLKTVIESAHGNSVFSIAFSPDGKKLMSGGRDALLKVWDCTQNFDCISSEPAHWYTINAIAFHPQGHLFATGSRDKTIKIWDANSLQLLKVIDTIKNGCHLNSVNSLFWSDYNHWLISASDDRSLMIWEIEEMK
jgi:WD40 repeat protein